MDFYSFEKNGRFGKLKDGRVVEITTYTLPESDEFPEEQELYYYDKGEIVFSLLPEFEKFDIHSSFLNDNPLEFGDAVMLKDIKASIFLELEEDQQETYDLYINKVGLVTEVIEEYQKVFVAFRREVVEMPIHLVEKVYEREIW